MFLKNAFNLFHTFIRRLIVNNNHFEIRIILPKNRQNTFFNVWFNVINRNNYRNSHITNYLHLLIYTIVSALLQHEDKDNIIPVNKQYN